MLDGEWQRYATLDDRLNDWINYTVDGTVSRGNFVMLKLRASMDISGVTWSKENAYPGANPQTNHYYKNTLKCLIDQTKRPYYYGFNIPSKNSINCYVPTIVYYSNDYVSPGGPTTTTIDYYEMNYAPAPPRPVYLTSGNLWGLTPILAANYRGYQAPTKMDVEIYDAIGTKVVDRSETDADTWFQILTTDGLLADMQYKWRCRFYDECGYASAWSAMSIFYLRTGPAIATITLDSTTTQRPTIEITTDEYGKPLKSIQVTIKETAGGTTVWTGDEEDAIQYKTADEAYEIPIDTHGVLVSGTQYKFEVTIKNTLDLTGADDITETLTFSKPSDPATLTITKTGKAYFQLDWATVGGITEYRVYRTIGGVKTFVEDVTGLS